MSFIKNNLRGDYKVLNKHFPCIEHHLFSELDALCTMFSLDDKCQISCWDTQIKFIIVDSIYVSILFSYETKRIGLRFYKDNSSKRYKNTPFIGQLKTVLYNPQVVTNPKKNPNDLRKEIKDLIKTKLNITSSNNKHNYNYDYDFKYSHHNCKKIVQMINLIVIHNLE